MENNSDNIIITALLKRFTKRRLPRLLDLEKKVFSGGQLNSLEIEFLNTISNDAKYVLQFSDKYPEYQEIVSKALQLYNDIMQKALENEQNHKK